MEAQTSTTWQEAAGHGGDQEASNRQIDGLSLVAMNHEAKHNLPSAERRRKKEREREEEETHLASNSSFKKRCHSSHRNVL